MDIYLGETLSIDATVYGQDGLPITTVVLSASLILGMHTPIVPEIAGNLIYATVLYVSVGEAGTGVWSGTTDVGGDFSVSFSYTVVSVSSSSVVPTNYVRQCKRLTEPADTTVEQYNSGNLAIYADIPYSLLRCVAANLPSSGPDVVNFSYVDTQGQARSLAFNCWCWMSDNAYIFVSADNGTQFAVASVNGNFYNSYAQAINKRNTNGGTSALMPCANASRYGWPALLVNQQLPSLFIYDGNVLGGGSSSSSSSG